MEETKLILSEFSHNYHPSGVKMVAKNIRRGISVLKMDKRNTMGLFGKLFGGGTSGGSVICPECGSPMYESGEDRYECSNSNCNSPVSFRVNGEIVDASTLSYRRRASAPAPRCVSCQESIEHGINYLPWEDGSNSHAYIICPYCGFENIQYGFGEDD